MISNISFRLKSLDKKQLDWQMICSFQVCVVQPPTTTGPVRFVKALSCKDLWNPTGCHEWPFGKAAGRASAATWKGVFFWILSPEKLWAGGMFELVRKTEVDETSWFYDFLLLLPNVLVVDRILGQLHVFLGRHLKFARLFVLILAPSDVKPLELEIPGRPEIPCGHF